MKFFSGFSLKNDEDFFKEYIDYSEYNVCGFSYGSILAFEYVKEQLLKGKRIDRLQLFSPAFFQTKSSKFKRLQTTAFNKNRKIYLKSFIKSCFLPYVEKDIQLSSSSSKELENLINFEWSIDELLQLENKGVNIEVYLGGEDNIVDSKEAREFFIYVSTVTYIKQANHFLQTN